VLDRLYPEVLDLDNALSIFQILCQTVPCVFVLIMSTPISPSI
jgi:hypothetical protein